MKKVYISGAITGYDEAERRMVFKDAERKLAEYGFQPVNPMEGVIFGLAHEEYMKKDIKLLLECDFIYMLPGWEKSYGSRLEHVVAGECGIKYLQL